LKIDIGVAPAAVGTTYTSTDIMSKLKPGDNVRAQILENSGNQLKLKFPDGTVVSATAASTIDAAEGEFANLTFKGILNDKPAFEVAEKNAFSQPDKASDNIRSTLASLKLPVTEENIQIAKALIDRNVQVTAENMAKMTQLIKENAGLKPDAAAFIIASKMTEDTNSIQKLQTLLSGRLKIGNDISELIKLLDSLGQNNSSSVSSPFSLNNTNSQVINQLVAKVIEQLTNKGIFKIDTASNGKLSENAESLVKDGQADMPNSANSTNSVSNGKVNSQEAAVQGKIREANILNSTADKSTQVNASANSQGNSAEAKITNAVNTANENNIEGNLKAAANADSSTGANNNVKVNADSNAYTNINGKNVEKSNADIGINIQQNTDSDKAQGARLINSNILDSSIVLDQGKASEKLMSFLRGQEIPGKSDLHLLNAFTKELHSLIDSGRLTGEELSAAKQLAGGEKLFAAAVNSIKDLFIKIDEKGESFNPVKLYKDIDDAIQVMKSTVQQLPQGIREAAATIVNNLDSNVNFINQLNNFSSYVQLPLSIFNKNTTGELYMLKRGPRSKKLDPSNMTVLISLDSNNIGRIDTLLSIDKRNISTNFRVENSDIFPILKEHHKELYNSLIEKGFRLVDFTYRLMEEPLNIVNFEAEAKKEFIKSSNNIDIII